MAQAILAGIRALLGDLRAWLLGTFLGSFLTAIGLLPPNGVAQEPSALYISNVVTNAQLAIQNPTYGLSALHTDLAEVHTLCDTIISALDGLGTGGLTTDEHNQLMALNTSGIADVPYYVWNWNTSRNTLDASGETIYTQRALEDIWAYVSAMAGWQGLPLPKNPYCAVVYWEPYRLSDSHLTWRGYSENVGDYPPLPDFSLWQAGDTPYSFLARTQPTYGWTSTDPAGNTVTTAWKKIEGYPGNTHGAFVRSIFRAEDVAPASVDLSAVTDKLDLIQPDEETSLTSLNVNEAAIGLDVGSILTLVGILMGGEAELTIQMVLDAIAALAAQEGSEIVVPPVWPGLDNVTLGTPVAFDGNVDVTADMDGVLVNLTVSPTKTGHYILGNVDLWYGLGRISFESDNGDVEPWQYLAFDNGIFAPKFMAHASAVHLQVLGGAEGTVTPWTITPPAPAPAVATAEYDYPTDDDDPAGC